MTKNQKKKKFLDFQCSSITCMLINKFNHLSIIKAGWWWRWRILGVNFFSELIISVKIEFLGLHQLFLLGIKPALEEPFKGRLYGCPEEKGIAKHEVKWGDIEANRLHDIPREFPEGEPHKGRGLDHHVAQPGPQLTADQCIRLLVNLRLVLLHLLQLCSPGIVGIHQRAWDNVLDGFCYLWSQELENKQYLGKTWSLTYTRGYSNYCDMVLCWWAMTRFEVNLQRQLNMHQ